MSGNKDGGVAVELVFPDGDGVRRFQRHIADLCIRERPVTAAESSR